MYFSSVPRCTVFGEAYESRAAHGNKKAAEQATEGGVRISLPETNVRLMAEIRRSPIYRDSYIPGGCRISANSITWKMVGYDPFLWGWLLEEDIKKSFLGFSRNYLDPRIFKKIGEWPPGCSPDCYVFHQQQQPRASKGWQFLLELWPVQLFLGLKKSLPQNSRIFLFVWKISTTKSWKSRWIRYIKYTSLGMCTKCWDPDHTDYCRMLHW